MKKFIVPLLSLQILFAWGMANAEYSGEGGMTAHAIKPEVYEYHYDHGFTGVDSMGWDPNLQYAWSRAGAALTCNVEIDKDLVLNNMSEEFGHDPFIHDLNGVSFHNMQSKNIEGFCSDARVKELEGLIIFMEIGDFPEKF